MNEQELCRKRLFGSFQTGEWKGIVLFSDFLNLNEQNIFHSLQKELYTTAKLSGGYEQAERQMVAFIPDALCYEWSYPFVCIPRCPPRPKKRENISSRGAGGGPCTPGVPEVKSGILFCWKMTFISFVQRPSQILLWISLRRSAIP